MPTAPSARKAPRVAMSDAGGAPLLCTRRMAAIERWTCEAGGGGSGGPGRRTARRFEAAAEAAAYRWTRRRPDTSSTQRWRSDLFFQSLPRVIPRVHSTKPS
eukprot:4048779-Prymnesium_polylepis.1